MAYQTLTLAFPEPTLAVVTLNRPNAANALNARMGKELAKIFSNFAKKSIAVRAIILTGEGRHFCAGADLKERKDMSKSAWYAQHKAFEKALMAILECPVPVIAAVNGTAMGGGLELAMACDFIYAAGSARFALPEVGLGIMPGLGGTQNLPRAIGQRHAKEFLFTGRIFSANEAYRMGLVNRVCDISTLLAESLTTASAIAENAPLSVRAVKKSVNEGYTLPLLKALQCELKYYCSLLATHDRHEGIAAFNEKRKAQFTGK